MSLTTYTSYEEFLPEVLPYVTNVSEIAAVNAIKNASIEFCKQSTLLRDEPDDIALEDGIADYDLDYPLGYNVSEILTASVGSCPLRPGPVELLQQLFGADWRTRSGPPQYYLREEPNVIRLVLKPDGPQTESLRVVLALQPSRGSTKVDTIIYENWAEAISFGARARLHDTPGQPYYDPQQAVKFRRWFENKIGEARIAAQRGQTRGPLYVRPPRFV
jgi:hypothetical protein